jgi:hypothetical protein
MARTSRRRRPLRRNPLSGKQKILGVGGIIAVGGLAAYALSRPGPETTTNTTPGPVGPSAVDCAQLQAQLNQMLAAPSPDAAAIRRKQTEVAACIAAVRASGGDVDNATSNLSDGDNAYQHIEDQFADYKRTSKDDPLKRNNVRQDILNVGTAMAASYSGAANAATDAASARAVRQSILRALDASVQRQLCYLYQLDPQCGRNGVNEDADEDKAGQEYARIVRPLLDAHGLAVQKLWSFGGSAAPDNAAYFTALLRPALGAIEYANRKFAEYKSVDSGLDPLRKNNLRQVVLTADRAQTAALQYAFEQADGYRDAPGMQAVATTILAALAPAIARWLCYLFGQPGCDTFAANEDANNVKADQEYAATIGPLSELYMRVAPKLISWNANLTAYEPFVALKLRRCSALNDFTNAKFVEYKSVDSGLDPLRKNNLRQVVLRSGALLAACLQDAMSTAITGANATPPTLIAQTTPAVTSSFRTLVGPISFAPTPTAGLGLTLSPVIAPISLAPTTTTTKTPTSTAPTGAALTVAVAGKRMIMAVVAVAKSALDASLTRQLCYLFGQPGCDTFAANEDANSVKADQEYAMVGRPLTAAIAQGATFLAGKDDPQAEIELLKSKLLFCNALVARVAAKFDEYKSVSWSDAARRNNLRVNEVLGNGRNAVACFRSTNPLTPTGRSMVKAAVDAALAASRARVACYNDSSSQCGRFGVNEDDNATKAAQETNDITNPLADISSRLASGQALSGLDDLMSDPASWVGAALVIGGAWWFLSRRSRPVRSNKRSKKRTSRRIAA